MKCNEFLLSPPTLMVSARLSSQLFSFFTCSATCATMLLKTHLMLIKSEVFLQWIAKILSCLACCIYINLLLNLNKFVFKFDFLVFKNFCGKFILLN